MSAESNNFYQKAKQSGFSDEEIIDRFQKDDYNFKERFKEAKKHGFSTEEIINRTKSDRSNKSPEELKNLSQRSKIFNFPGVKTALGAVKSIAETAASIPQGIEALARKSIEISPVGIPGSKKFIKKHPEPFIKVGGDDLKKYIEKKIPYLKPSDKFDEFVQEVAGPAAFNFVSGMGAIRALAVTAGGTVAKDLTKSLGFKESTQQKAKIFTELSLAMINPRGALGYIGRRYENQMAELPRGAQVNANRYTHNLTHMRNQMQQGVQTPQTREITRVIDEALHHVDLHGNIPIENLAATQRTVNELRRNRGLFNMPGEPRTPGATRLLNRVANEVHETLNQYGAQNPQWLRGFRQADEAFAIYHRSQQASNWMRQHAHHTVLPLVTELLVAPVLAGKTALGAASIYGAAKTGELLYRIMASPVLRSYYLDALGNSVLQNAAQMNKDLIKLQKAIENEDKKANGPKEPIAKGIHLK